MQAANERERLEANQKKIEREIRKHEKELKKKGFLPGEPESEPRYILNPRLSIHLRRFPNKSKPSLAEAERQRARQGTGSADRRTAHRKL